MAKRKQKANPGDLQGFPELELGDKVWWKYLEMYKSVLGEEGIAWGIVSNDE